MNDFHSLEILLGKLNIEYRRRDIHPRERPFAAIKTCSESFGAIAIPSEIATFIFDWFTRNTPEGSHEIGPMYRGVFYFDSIFWPVYIPMGYGMVRVNATSSLETMSERFRNQIEADIAQRWSYMLLWADCVDFGYGHDDYMNTSTHDPFAKQLFGAAYDHLTAAVAQLLQSRPESRALESCRLSIEMILKSIIVAESGLTDVQLRKKIGHNLETAADLVLAAVESPTIAALKDKYSLFPPVTSRYEPGNSEPADLWRAYTLAQQTAATFTRLYTDRNIRGQVMSSAQ